MEEPEIRAATPRDVQTLRDLASAFTSEHTEQWGKDGMTSWSQREIKSTVQHRDACVLIAESGGKAVGFATGVVNRQDPRSPVGRIDAVFVLPGQRGRGAAERLMGALMQGLQDRGADTLELVVSSKNRRALAFFGKFGFGEGDRVMAVEPKGGRP